MYKFTWFVIFITTVAYSQDNNDTAIITKTYSQRWELELADKKGTFRLMSYKPIYITAGRISTYPNKLPQSENPEYSASERIAYNNIEAKFQLSFKTKVVQDLFWGKGDIWVGYTQKAHWQIYNSDISKCI